MFDGNLWPNSFEQPSRPYYKVLNEDAIFLPFLLFFLLTPCMATNLKISGLDLVLCTKIAWKIQIWRCICCIRCLTCSNLTFWAILWLFFSYFKYIWQLFAMNPKLAKTFDTIFLTNFLCSFTWWGSYVGLMKTSLTFLMVCDEK